MKKNFKDNKSVINMMHIQFGQGKVMPALFLQELLKSEYDMDSQASYAKDFMPVKHYFTFEPLSSESHNYIYNQEVLTTDKTYDIWNSKARMELCEQCDNNNGGMLIEITQKYDDNGNPRTYGDFADVKIGFCLGNEEVDYWHKKLNGYIPIEKSFERVVSVAEYIDRTFKTGKKDNSNAIFLQSFVNMCKLFGVEQVFEEGGRKAFDDKWFKIDTLIQTYTKDVADGQSIDIPKELQEKVLVYN